MVSGAGVIGPLGAPTPRQVRGRGSAKQPLRDALEDAESRHRRAIKGDEWRHWRAIKELRRRLAEPLPRGIAPSERHVAAVELARANHTAGVWPMRRLVKARWDRAPYGRREDDLRQFGFVLVGELGLWVYFIKEETRTRYQALFPAGN